jgi:5-methyltetrahydrofolate--homocysteine methyltransferase
VKIDPVYTQPAIHVKDASKSVPVVNSLISKSLKKDFIAQVKKEYAELRDSYAGAQNKQHFVSLPEARRNKFKIDWAVDQASKPAFVGLKTLENYSIAEISWIFFFIVWQIKGKYPEILNDPQKGEEARKLLDDANQMLDLIEKENWLKANAVYGIFPANSVGDDIEVYTDDSRTKVQVVFRNLRNQELKENGEANYCLSDFIAPKESGVADYIGAFAVTAGIGMDERVNEFKRNLDDYNAIMLEALSDRLAEALTELVHEKIRKELWGYAPDEKLSLDDMILEKYKGIRPAHGYPACPDHSEKDTLFKLLNATKNTGVILTESFSMYPAASVSGLIFAHPKSHYFFVDKISRDQVEDYARRKGNTPEVAEKWLGANLNYK